MASRRVLNGIHASNHPDTFIEEMMLVTRATGAVVVLHQLMLPDDTMLGEPGGDADNYNWMPLRFGRDAATQGGWDAPPAPERLIVVRIWQANDPFQFDPAARAEYIVRRLEQWTAPGYPRHNLLADPFVAVQATNEANIEPASSLELAPTERYDRIARWETAFWDAFDRAAPGRRCMSCGPNLAAGHDWLTDQPDSEYDHPGIRDLCQRHIDTGGLLGIHVYNHAQRPWEQGGPGQANQYWYWLRPFRPVGWRDSAAASLPHDKGGVVVRFPTARFAVTEAGTWRHDDPTATAETLATFRAFLDAAAHCGRFVAFCPFIWDTNQAVHPQNRIAGNETLRAGLVELADVPAADLPKAEPGAPRSSPDQITAGPELLPKAAAEGFAWPVGSSAAARVGPALPEGWMVSLGFGEEYELDGKLAIHPGVDLNLRTGGDSDLGAPVVASAAGVVVASSYWPVWGNIVMVRHRLASGADRWTQYAHLRERLVESGDQLAAGTQLGTVGKGADDRYSAHLHFEVRSAPLPADHWPGTDKADVQSHYLDPASVVGPPGLSDPDLLALRQWADGAQVIQPNEAAALQRAIRKDGYYPISGEGDVSGYRAQLARHLDSASERIYYAKIGDWSNVRWMARR